MTDLQAFIDQLAATPDDDTARLVFADWLDERGGAVPCPECNGTGNNSGRHPPARHDSQCSLCHAEGVFTALSQRLRVAMRRVCENPDDDGPRLAYADCLDGYAGDMECPACKGDSPPITDDEFAAMVGRCEGQPLAVVGKGLESLRCVPCRDTGRVPDAMRVRAEFIRCQISGVPWYDKNFTEAEFNCEFVKAAGFRPEPRIKHGTTGIHYPGFDCVVAYDRGFIDSLILSAADWLRVHEAVYWHPKQTVECPRCSGQKWHYVYGFDGPAWTECGGCKGDDGKPTGRVTCPFVPTAQPIMRVRLTTWPGETPGWNDVIETPGDRRGDGFTYYDRWPGLKFRMPNGGVR